MSNSVLQDAFTANSVSIECMRDYFAAQALSACVDFDPRYCDEIATLCYRMADAMLKAREAS